MGSISHEDYVRMRTLEYQDYTRQEMLEAVKSPTWQLVRLSMKGLSTTRKLEVLEQWYLSPQDLMQFAYPGMRTRKIQINNYLDALRRGGLLPPRNQGTHTWKDEVVW